MEPEGSIPVYNSSLPVSILNQINPFHTLQTFILKSSLILYASFYA
jgi:hypothetical protein